ncbi:MAG: ArsA family ATPase [Actinomycetia bacterium]|nr:ArsA family ATPase [Actinomycetes bacterium]
MPATRLLIVVGKGGVGRSTVSAALALQAAATGKRVLAIDASAGNGLGRALGLEEPLPPGHQVSFDDPPTLVALALDTEAALDEYVGLNLKTPIAPRLVRSVARIFEYVATAAPAVREILTIGKIGNEVRQGSWDLVVADAPATGHAVELLSAPDTLKGLVGRGPLAADTAWISELLADPETTSLVVVTVAEELAVSETQELLDRLAAETTASVSSLVVNRWPPAVTAAGRAEAASFVAGTNTTAGSRAVEINDAQLVGAIRVAVFRAARAAEEFQRLEVTGLPLRTIDEADDPVAAAIAALEDSGL